MVGLFVARFTDEVGWRNVFGAGIHALEAFAVMREGMAGKAGIGKVALYGREYLVAIRPQKKGLVMYTLHHDAEIRGIDQIAYIRFASVYQSFEDLEDLKREVDTLYAEKGNGSHAT